MDWVQPFLPDIYYKTMQMKCEAFVEVIKKHQMTLLNKRTQPELQDTINKKRKVKKVSTGFENNQILLIGIWKILLTGTWRLKN